jgi:hypothetical protein
MDYVVWPVPALNHTQNVICGLESTRTVNDEVRWVDPSTTAIWQRHKRDFAARLSSLGNGCMSSLPYVLGLVYPGECVTCPTYYVRMDCINTQRGEELETSSDSIA